MHKRTLLILIGITSLIFMACGISGYSQQKIESNSNIVTATVQASSQKTAQPSGENQSVLEQKPSDLEKSTIFIIESPTPTIDPLSSAQSCLAKTWKIEGLSEYVVSAVPAELVEQYSLEYVDTSGQAFLKLSSDGKIVLQADNLVFLFNARYSIFEVPVKVSIDGFAAGNYEFDETTLIINNMDTSNLTASAKALDEDVIDPNMIIDSIPFVRPPFNTAKYSCQGDTLELELSGYQDKLPPLVFQSLE